MRSQEERDEQTVAIATALGIFLLIAAAAMIAIGVVVYVAGTDMGAGHARDGVLIVVCFAATVAATHLIRSTRR